MARPLSKRAVVARRSVLAAAAAACGPVLAPLRSLAATRQRVNGGSMDVDRFVADCVAASREADAQAAVAEVLARAVATPRAVLEALEEPTQAGIRPLHRSKTLTIFSATWTPQMTLVPLEGDVASLPVDVIHSVNNPLGRYTGGIHIYGGDFFDTARSRWNPESLQEEASDGARIREMFERENARQRCATERATSP